MSGRSSRISLPFSGWGPAAHMLAGSILIALGPFFVEFSQVSAITSTFYRMVIGGFAFLFISLFYKKEAFPIKWLYACLPAGFLLAIDLYLCNQSTLYVGSGLAAVLSNLEIVFLVLIGRYFFNEKIPSSFLILFALIVLGIFCLIFPHLSARTPQGLWGIFYALLASFSYGIYVTLIKAISSKCSRASSVSMLSIICFFGSLCLGSVMVIHDSAGFYIPNWMSAGCILFYSVLSQVLGWWFITKGMKYISLSLSGILLLSQPALTFIIDYFFFKRNTEGLQVFGCFLLLVTVYMTINKYKKDEVANEQ